VFYTDAHKLAPRLKGKGRTQRRVIVVIVVHARASFTLTLSFNPTCLCHWVGAKPKLVHAAITLLLQFKKSHKVRNCLYLFTFHFVFMLLYLQYMYTTLNIFWFFYQNVLVVLYEKHKSTALHIHTRCTRGKSKIVMSLSKQRDVVQPYGI